MLKSRLITALILIPLVITALFWLPFIAFAIVTLLICILAAWEWAQLAGLPTVLHRIWLAASCGLLLMLMLFTFSDFHNWRHSPYACGLLWISIIWWSLALAMVLFYPRCTTWWRKSCTIRLLFGMLTIAPFFGSMVVLRQLNYDADRFTGAWWLLYVMLLVWSVDSGGYLFGRLFGKHKLAPRVSLGKTWEGLVGGLVTAMVLSWLFSLRAPLAIAPQTLLLCSFIAALASVLGDLTESMFKREAGIKDSGNIIPGHGGILDRIDSLTAAVPVFASLLLLVLQVI